MKRVKRKAKEQLAGGGLASLVAHLDDNDDNVAETITKSRQPQKSKAKGSSSSEKGKIGEGKGRTLGESQRRKQM
jgi:hypothetical protein